MKRWVVAAKRADFDAIARKYGITPMLARIIRNRDITEDKDIEKFLKGNISDLYSPSTLKDIDKALLVIKEARDNSDKVRIVGDYDIDGVCASYILKRGLTAYGLYCDVRLPDRVRDGYGINLNIIDEAIRDGIKLIVTCDNGIAAQSEIKYAKEHDINVVITDHHEIPYEIKDDKKEYLIPVADAVIDPKQEDCKYPFKEICGALVAFKLVEYLLNSDGRAKFPDKNEYNKLMKDLLQFAAFATVGDIMPLLDENRIIVKYGLKFMAQTDNIGLKALIDVSELDKNNITPYHIGFILGPCVNATGRLDNATRALSLFLSNNRAEAVTIAKELKDLNDNRKQMTEFYTFAAIELAENMKEDSVLVIYIPDCHESLAGIVAGRIKERFYKPTFVLTKGEGCVKGSGRSIEAYNMHEKMTEVKELFLKFGGHKMAAGFSISEENVDELRRRLNENANLSEEDLTEKVVIDIAMPMEYATEAFVNELDLLAPYGTGNPKPVFAQKNVRVEGISIFGQNRNVIKVKLKPENGDRKFDGILFGNGDEIAEELSRKSSYSIIYCPQINEYMGNRNVQIAIKDWI